jgi:hypothetical protein
LRQFYERLLNALQQPAVRQGRWQLAECVPAWDGNVTSNAFIASAWENASGERMITCVNFAGQQSQCYLRLRFPNLGGRQWRLRDLLSDARYERDGNDLQSGGLFMDVPPWQYHVFDMTAA